MYAGQIVEIGLARDVLKSPHGPYSQGLLSLTVIGATPDEPIQAIKGMAPDLANMPSGCAFAPRCPFATAECQFDAARLTDFSGTHQAICLNAKAAA